MIDHGLCSSDEDSWSATLYLRGQQLEKPSGWMELELLITGGLGVVGLECSYFSLGGYPSQRTL